MYIHARDEMLSSVITFFVDVDGVCGGAGLEKEEMSFIFWELGRK